MPPLPTYPHLPEGPVLVTRRVHFCAAHRLDNPAETQAWNREAFGGCNNELWHGHNYELEVSVLGEPDPQTGYVMDLKELKDVLETRILAKCDHANLNLQVDFLAGINPTTENLVKAFWMELDDPLKSPSRRLYRVRLLETARNLAEYEGPKGFRG